MGGGINPPLSTPSPAPLGLGDRHLPGLLVGVRGGIAPSGSFRYSGIALSALANLKSLRSSASGRIKKGSILAKAHPPKNSAAYLWSAEISHCKRT